MVPYQYQKLGCNSNYIRVIELHRGEPHEKIRISITDKSLQPARAVKSWSTDEVVTPISTKMMPNGWCVSKNLEGRAIFYKESKDGHVQTSWVHLGANSKRLAHTDAIELKAHSESTRFEAISYTWGKMEFLDEIEIVDTIGSSLQPPQTLNVGPNLVIMLRYLRQSHESRLLWIDAICINQDDLIERGEQVRLMANIYTLADRVVVWLGESSQDSDLALESLEHIGKQLEYTQDGYCLPSPDSTEQFWYREEYIGGLAEKDWTAIASLIQRPYFERLWILQEIQAANHGSAIQCGLKVAPWYHIRRAFLQVYKLAAGLRQFSTPLLKSRLHHLYRISNSLNALDSDKLFHMASKCQCSDPRDKIFAVLGLLPRKFASNIKITYEAAVDQIYMQSYLSYIDFTHRLTLLGSITMGNATSTRPSWVPNFEQLDHERMVSFYNFASTFSAAEALFEAPNKLHVAGVYSDTIATVGPLLTEDLKMNFRFIQNLRARLGSSMTACEDQDFLDACCWVLTLGDLRERWIDLDVIPSLQEMRNYLIEKEDGLAGESLISRYKHWYQVLVTDMGCERLFLTREGRVGCGPSSVQNGDEISVLLGYAYPVAIRPIFTLPNSADRTFRVVGPAYVHGLMDGEGILGPLPLPWTLVVRNPSNLQTSYTAVTANPSFYNQETRQHERQDPRLGLPGTQWQSFSAEDEARLGTSVLSYKHIATGRLINYDPNLTAGILKSRGVPIKTITLV